MLYSMKNVKHLLSYKYNYEFLYKIKIIIPSIEFMEQKHHAIIHPYDESIINRKLIIKLLKLGP